MSQVFSLFQRAFRLVILAGVTLSLVSALDFVAQNPDLPARLALKGAVKVAETLLQWADRNTPVDLSSLAAVSVVGGGAQEIADSDASAPRTGLPSRLIIPAIKVDSDIEYVGLDASGAMAIPKNPDTVAWFELGQRPGQNGSAVIAGHFGWKNGKAAVFDSLSTLRKGDRLYVVDAEGMMLTFVVREKREYDPDADAGDVFSSADGRAHLNLITCEGVWNKKEKSYSRRLVVFTDREPEGGGK